MSLATVVHHAVSQGHSTPHSQSQADQASTSHDIQESNANEESSSLKEVSNSVRRSQEEHQQEHTAKQDDAAEFDRTSKSPNHIIFKSPPNTPAARTGPPRSLSFAYSLPHSPMSSRENSGYEDIQSFPSTPYDSNDYSFSFATTDFRGALEYYNNAAERQDRKGKKRESRAEEGWNPMRWFQDSPKEEKSGMDFSTQERKYESDDQGVHEEDERNEKHQGTSVHGEDTNSTPNVKAKLRRAMSVPHTSSDNKAGKAKWAKLRSLMPKIVHSNEPILPGPSMVTSQAVNITDELITGGLATLMLRLWMERDEKGLRRVPVLFHRLRIRISDSLHPMHGHKSVFRIECEYANGAARWVIYRQLRDFLSLHTHYTISNAYNRNVENMPEFPKTSIPYFKFLREKNDQVGRADFARLQREELETYLINLIRAVMFHPSSNRLAGFLEISALSMALAQSGGAQYKGGYLHIESPGNGPGFGRKSASWKSKREARWCAVRESYIVAMESPAELTVWDVFLIDSDFRIERPKRYYRQPLNSLLHATEGQLQGEGEHGGDGHLHLHLPIIHHSNDDQDRRSVIGSIKSRVSRILHLDSHSAKTFNKPEENGHAENDNLDARSLQSSSSGSSGPSLPPRQRTPMLDPSVNVNPIVRDGEHSNANDQQQKKKKKSDADVSKHTFYIVNSQMRLKLFAKTERQMLQWITALEKMAEASHYMGKNRFDSFAPIRLNVAAQWLVDGRDYFWNLSRAILLAKECIYIHDWWLSPELLMRRPGKERYRLDRLLERKAKEGVKIYIILYQEVSNRTTPTDSNYAKQRLSSLHPNVMVQRSPSHFQTGTFYWAHHEKLCVIDQAIAFMGGLDLCFGRWDTAQHVLTDDVDGSEQPEIWPGKDYSNPRIADFCNLNKPEEDMYDRSKIPRMPWHDVGMQIVGQPARDLARHFVQRWNYLLRIKNHSRVMPFLLPPPEFRPGELTRMGLTGTCELQICRSCGPWSMGTSGKIEHSIQNAYLKAIQMSEHFVYIENQFFITSTVVNDVKVENNIGDAIVHRIIRAHRDGTPWKCCIVIPLLPGFTFPVDHSDASAIRIILECQNRTIARGPNSIFSRLRKEGINPDDYISVFSLRNWAKLRGEVLTTEQVYIHGKVCIVDDRLAIIGSANINERSQRGDRDSELAAIIRDTDMMDCTMAGRPFQVGRFAHTLRVRLMREHVGVDVDALDEENLMANEPREPEYEQQEPWDPESEQAYGQSSGVTRIKKSQQHTAAGVLAGAALDSANQALHASGEATSTSAAKVKRKLGLAHNSVAQNADDETLRGERKDFEPGGHEETGFASSVVPTIEEEILMRQDVLDKGAIAPERAREREGMSSIRLPKEKDDEEPEEKRTEDGELYGAPAGVESPLSDDRPHRSENTEDDQATRARSTIRKQLNSKLGSKWNVNILRPQINPNSFEDPIRDAFWIDVWKASASFNTEIYRKVFHAIPDDIITTWKQYKEFVAHHERLNKPVRDGASGEPVARVPSETGDDSAPGRESTSAADGDAVSDSHGEEGEKFADSSAPESQEPKARKGAKGVEPYEKWERDEMERLLGELNGHLVVYPTRFLEGEDIANNFLFNADRLLPLPIYN
ncbi:hypothetical protein BDQ17DRAFT_1343417 [Cyathus striatus]|nr:hypothetical protein BDQ17DRAFT_1343417 [Cyathus striatus]